MKFQKVNAAFSLALCACLLAGCSIDKSNQSNSVQAESVAVASTKEPPVVESPTPTPNAEAPSIPEETSPAQTDNSSSQNEEDFSASTPDLEELQALLNESEILYWLPDDYSLGTTDLDWTSIYAIASQWLRMYAARNGQEIPMNERGTPYFPISDFDTVTEEVLGLSQDYAAWAEKNDDAAPQGMLCVMWGYGTAYSELTVQKDSLEISGDQFSVVVENSVSSPGDNRTVQTKRLHFTANPSYQFSAYRLVGIENLE